jgi:hypothetical protein
MARKRYYKFVVRIEKDLGKFELDGLKRLIWNHLNDIAITDIQAGKCNRPQTRFEGDPVVRK